MTKLKDMVSAVTEGTNHLQPSVIASKINKKFTAKVTDKEVSAFLNEQFYPDEIKKLEERYKGFDGRYYF